MIGGKWGLTSREMVVIVPIRGSGMRDMSLKMETFVLFLLSSKGVAWTMFIAGMTFLVVWL